MTFFCVTRRESLYRADGWRFGRSVQGRKVSDTSEIGNSQIWKDCPKVRFGRKEQGHKSTTRCVAFFPAVGTTVG